MKQCLASLLLILVWGPLATAHTSMEQEAVCPLCDTTFQTIVDLSGTSFGVRLDLKPTGPIVAPWRIPVCPNCRFVLYRGRENTIPPEELARCAEIVSSDAYLMHTNRASHYLWGILFENLGESPHSIANLFLQAFWQEEDDPVRYRDCLERSLRHFEIYLQESRTVANPTVTEKGWPDDVMTAHLLKGEILRRLGRFREAQNHFAALQRLAPYRAPVPRKIIRFQIRLCKNGDAEPHELSEALYATSFLFKTTQFCLTSAIGSIFFLLFGFGGCLLMAVLLLTPPGRGIPLRGFLVFGSLTPIAVALGLILGHEMIPIRTTGLFLTLTPSALAFIPTITAGAILALRKSLSRRRRHAGLCAILLFSQALSFLFIWFAVVHTPL